MAMIGFIEDELGDPEGAMELVAPDDEPPPAAIDVGEESRSCTPYQPPPIASSTSTATSAGSSQPDRPSRWGDSDRPPGPAENAPPPGGGGGGEAVPPGPSPPGCRRPGPDAASVGAAAGVPTDAASR